MMLGIEDYCILYYACNAKYTLYISGKLYVSCIFSQYKPTIFLFVASIIISLIIMTVLVSFLSRSKEVRRSKEVYSISFG